jgi:hypothetical protein
LSASKKPFRAWAKAKLPRTYGFFRRVGYRIKRRAIIKSNFTRKYVTNGWSCEESRSGYGSTLASAAGVRRELPGLLGDLGIQSMLDIPCGDLNWLKDLDLKLRQYIGADVVEPLVQERIRCDASPNRRFVRLDLTRDDLPRVDLILCRDCLVHFDYDHIRLALRQIKRSGSNYLLTTTFAERKENRNIMTGEWRPLNLQLPPFNLPPPQRVIHETSTEENETDKRLALWPIANLPNF